MNITKHKEGYIVEKDGVLLAKIETYRNPYHMSNCYINFDLDSLVRIEDTNIFQLITDEEKSSLQVMLSSLETQKASFLSSQGFKKVRICYEMEVKKKDLKMALSPQQIDISKANWSQSDYKDCCKLMFKYYKDTHEPINPLSCTFDEFIKLMPAEVYFVGSSNDIHHVAFVNDNEIAYVSSRDEISFDRFALAVVNELYKDHQSIVFEADHVDSAAMRLKSLFLTDTTETFDTWIYKKSGISS
ncbi:hypothetical protein HZY86_09225 [Aerococcaceae bacterium DSM 111020]|nr:hypothetical protein [Aerococcaceae bacterium DSM 111020]